MLGVTFVGNWPRVIPQWRIPFASLETADGMANIAVDVTPGPGCLSGALSSCGRHPSGGASSPAPTALGRGRGRSQ